MREWFREYKVAEGKPLNAFALGERCMDRAYTEKVIEETHGSWKKAEEKLRELAAPK
jgi:inorganic pyrophosphatase